MQSSWMTAEEQTLTLPQAQRLFIMGKYGPQAAKDASLRRVDVNNWVRDVNALRVQYHANDSKSVDLRVCGCWLPTDLKSMPLHQQCLFSCMRLSCSMIHGMSPLTPLCDCIAHAVLQAQIVARFLCGLRVVVHHRN